MFRGQRNFEHPVIFGAVSGRAGCGESLGEVGVQRLVRDQRGHVDIKGLGGGGGGRLVGRGQPLPRAGGRHIAGGGGQTRHKVRQVTVQRLGLRVAVQGLTLTVRLTHSLVCNKIQLIYISNAL